MRVDEVSLYETPAHSQWEINFVLTRDRGRGQIYKIASHTLDKPLNYHMQQFVKSLKLYFEKEVQEIITDDYGYSMSVFVKRTCSITITSNFGNNWLYKEAIREYRRRFGKLIRVEAIWNMPVVKTNEHKDLPIFTDELVF